MRDYIPQLAEMPLFYGVEQEDLDHMLSCLNGYTKAFDKGSYVVLADDSVPCVGVVLSGSVQMLKEDFWGNKTILAVSRTGDLFGETFVCAGVAASSVTFWAPVPMRALLIPFNRVMHSCNMSCRFHHRLIENMMVMVAKKNMMLMEKLEVTSKKTLRDKILTYLALQAPKDGSKYIQVPLGRVELAEYLCADRSALTRELSNMKRDGIIDYDKNTFVLLSCEQEAVARQALFPPQRD